MFSFPLLSCFGYKTDYDAHLLDSTEVVFSFCLDFGIKQVLVFSSPLNTVHVDVSVSVLIWVKNGFW